MIIDGETMITGSFILQRQLRRIMLRRSLKNLLVYCVRSPFTLNVIPGLTRNPMISTGFLLLQE